MKTWRALDFTPIRGRNFALNQLEAAMDGAAKMRGLDITVVSMG